MSFIEEEIITIYEQSKKNCHVSLILVGISPTIPEELRGYAELYLTTLYDEKTI